MAHIVFASELEELATELAAARAMQLGPAVAEPLDRVARQAQRLAAKARTLPTAVRTADGDATSAVTDGLAAIAASVAAIGERLARLENRDPQPQTAARPQPAGLQPAPHQGAYTWGAPPLSQYPRQTPGGVL